MAQVQYNGEQTLEFPTLGFTVSKGDVVTVPDDFEDANFTPVTAKSNNKQTPTDNSSTTEEGGESK